MDNEDRKDTLASLLDSLRIAATEIEKCEQAMQQAIGERSHWCERYGESARKFMELAKGNEEYII